MAKRFRVEAALYQLSYAPKEDFNDQSYLPPAERRPKVTNGLSSVKRVLFRGTDFSL